MLSRRQLRLFTVLTLFFAVAQASWFDFHIFGRQNNENAVSASTTSGADPNATQSQTSSSVSQSSSVSSTPSSTPSVTPTSSTPSVSSTPSNTPSSSSSSTPPVTSSTPSSTSSTPSSTPSSIPTTSSPVSKTSSKTSSFTSTSEFTSSSSSVIVFTTVLTVGGSLTTQTGSSTSVAVTTGTSTAVLSADASSSSSKGISPKTKNTIIGVVVGIGGAAILAGLFVVAWRIWGRKKSNDDDDGLMGFRSGSAGHEKTSSVSGAGQANPFQSTLENYHNPARGNVNASSNF